MFWPIIDFIDGRKSFPQSIFHFGTVSILHLIILKHGRHRNRCFGRKRDTVLKPGLRCIQRFCRNIHAQESLSGTSSVCALRHSLGFECQTRLRSDEDRQRHNDVKVMERVRPQYSFHCFS